MPCALVIDDEPALTTIVGRFLERSGFEVATATSGLDGLQKARAKPPDVAIVDVMMPDMDGYQVCQHLRRDPRTTRTAILMLTARGQSVDRQMALQAGADAHAVKPFNGKALVEEIQGLLDVRAASRPPRGFQVVALTLKDRAGTTTLATNLGLCLADEQNCLSVIVDMVLRGGDVGAHLGLSPTASWVEAPRMDADNLVEHLVRHRDKLFVLPSPAPRQVGRLDLTVVEHHLARLREWHDCVILDTPRDLGPMAPMLLRSSHLVLLLLTPEPGILRTARASLAAMKTLARRPLRIWPVLNPLHIQPQAATRTVEEALGIRVAATLPWSPEVCARATANHRPVVLSAPESPLAQAFRTLAGHIAQVVGATPEERTRA